MAFGTVDHAYFRNETSKNETLKVAMTAGEMNFDKHYSELAQTVTEHAIWAKPGDNGERFDATTFRNNIGKEIHKLFIYKFTDQEFRALSVNARKVVAQTAAKIGAEVVKVERARLLASGKVKFRAAAQMLAAAKTKREADARAEAEAASKARAEAEAAAAAKAEAEAKAEAATKIKAAEAARVKAAKPKVTRRQAVFSTPFLIKQASLPSPLPTTSYVPHEKLEHIPARARALTLDSPQNSRAAD